MSQQATLDSRRQAVVHPTKLDLRQVGYFCVLAEELHFSRSADMLNLSQPALSRAIRSLEQVLGAQLLKRSHHNVELTDAGRVLLRHGKALLARQSEALAEIDELRGQAGCLRIGYTDIAPGRLLAPVVRRFVADLPGVAVKLRHIGPDEEANALARGMVDVVFVRERPNDPAIAYEQLLAEALLVQVPCGHPLADRASVTAEDVDKEQFLPRTGGDGAPPGTWLGTPALHRCIRRWGPATRSYGEMTQYVAAGLGVGLAVRSLITASGGNYLAAVPLVDGGASALGLAWRAETRLRHFAAFRCAAATSLPV